MLGLDDKNRRRFRRQVGFALIDLMLTVGAIALIGGSSYLIYRTVTKDSDTQKQIDGIVDFVNKSKQLFGLSGGNWTSFTSPNMIKSERIPPQFSKDTAKIYDAFGNEVLFAAAVANEGDVSFTMRSPEECVKITQAIAELTFTSAVGASGSETIVKTGTTPLDVTKTINGCAASSPVLKIGIR